MERRVLVCVLSLTAAAGAEAGCINENGVDACCLESTRIPILQTSSTQLLCTADLGVPFAGDWKTLGPHDLPITPESCADSLVIESSSISSASGTTVITTATGADFILDGVHICRSVRMLVGGEPWCRGTACCSPQMEKGRDYHPHPLACRRAGGVYIQLYDCVERSSQRARRAIPANGTDDDITDNTDNTDNTKVVWAIVGATIGAIMTFAIILIVVLFVCFRERVQGAITCLRCNRHKEEGEVVDGEDIENYTLTRPPRITRRSTVARVMTRSASAVTPNGLVSTFHTSTRPGPRPKAQKPIDRNKKREKPAVPARGAKTKTITPGAKTGGHKMDTGEPSPLPRHKRHDNSATSSKHYLDPRIVTADEVKVDPAPSNEQDEHDDDFIYKQLQNWTKPMPLRDTAPLPPSYHDEEPYDNYCCLPSDSPTSYQLSCDQTKYEVMDDFKISVKMQENQYSTSMRAQAEKVDSTEKPPQRTTYQILKRDDDSSDTLSYAVLGVVQPK